MLTKRQLDVFRMIDKHFQEHGTAPTYSEIKDALGLYSTSNAHDIVERLIERGYVRRRRLAARGLEIIRFPYSGEEGAHILKFRGEVEDALQAYAISQGAAPETIIAEAVASYLGLDVVATTAPDLESV